MASTPDVIWLRQRRSTTGRPAQLTLERITEAAVAIADARGLDAVTMRQLAADLGTGAATLYRHVRTREDVLDLMADQVAASYRFGPGSGDPVADLVSISEQIRGVMVTHPWMTRLSLEGNRIGPHQIRAVEDALLLLATAPGSPAEHLDAFTTIVAFTAMFVEQDLSYGVGAERFDWMTHQLASGHFPRTTMAIIGIRRQADEQPHERFRRLACGVARGLLSGETD